MRIEPTRDLPDAQARHRAHLVNTLYYLRFGINHLIGGQGFIGFADIAISVRCATENANFTGSSAMAFASPRTFKDLRAFVLRNLSLDEIAQMARSGLAGSIGWYTGSLKTLDG